MNLILSLILTGFLRRFEICAEVGEKPASRGIELCHVPGEVTSGKPEVPGKPEVIRKTAITAN